MSLPGLLIVSSVIAVALLFGVSCCLTVNPPSSLSHIRCSSFVPYVRGQTPRLQETPLCRTHQLALQDRTNGLERGMKHSKSAVFKLPSSTFVHNTQMLVHQSLLQNVNKSLHNCGVISHCGLIETAATLLILVCVLLCRLETWVWTLELRESLWATDRKVSQLTLF